MKATFFAESATAKKRGIFSFFKKNKARTIRLVEYWGVFYAFGEDADILGHYFNTESCDRFESRNAGVAAERLYWIISCMTNKGYRMEIVARVPD